MKALLIDHDDSFTFNLRNWLYPIFDHIEVVNHRDVTTTKFSDYDLLIISPGPKSPADYKHTIDLLECLNPNQKVLGICLGMQMMALTEKASITPYSPPKHGKKSSLKIINHSYMKFDELMVARYHSLACNFSVNQNKFEIIAISVEDQIPLWIKHTQKNWIGWQFHPESFLTENSNLLLNEIKNWCHT